MDEMKLEQEFFNHLKDKYLAIECPITMCPIQDPVFHVVNGVKIYFERSAIEQWLINHSTCPVTRVPISYEQIQTAYRFRDVVTLSEKEKLFINESMVNRVDYEAKLKDLLRRHIIACICKNKVNLLNKYWGHVPEYLDLHSLKILRWPALSDAALRGYVRATEFLIHHGADLESKTNNGFTPLLWAINNNQPAIVQLLFEAGANSSCLQNYSVFCDLSQRCYNYSPSQQVAHLHKKYQLSKILLNKTRLEGNFDCKDENNNTLLHIASRMLDGTVFVKGILEAGVDVNVVNNDGITPLHNALSKWDNLNVVNLLIRNGADVNATSNDGTTPLHCAVDKFDDKKSVQITLNTINLLIAKGADVNARDSLGRTPLHIVSHFKNAENIVERLLEAGADPTILDYQGHTALDIATKIAKDFYPPFKKTISLLQSVLVKSPALPDLIIHLTATDNNRHESFERPDKQDALKLNQAESTKYSRIHNFFTNLKRRLCCINSDDNDINPAVTNNLSK